eukprot:Protomagalhaensia_wolfi_Nauph_80__1267@NODE_1749_length_1361_cov_3658_381997_g172_i2_p1_GENE_NODE_1749_length_1361_cov_3658_381997_g172_i2NODE_1749_length_1361_cov_3658_381997_g172_i2_p1_ORF_typecomplete_len227_score29_71zfParamyxP/PF13008_7/0_062_NODE_1749_length_1361_cov_3658_381997_g172_i2184864
MFLSALVAVSFVGATALLDATYSKAVCGHCPSTCSMSTGLEEDEINQCLADFHLLDEQVWCEVYIVGEIKGIAEATVCGGDSPSLLFKTGLPTDLTVWHNTAVYVGIDGSGVDETCEYRLRVAVDSNSEILDCGMEAIDFGDITWELPSKESFVLPLGLPVDVFMLTPTRSCSHQLTEASLMNDDLFQVMAILKSGEPDYPGAPCPEASVVMIVLSGLVLLYTMAI